MGSLSSCNSKDSRNYEYMPNMYRSIPYDTYGEYDNFVDGNSALIPPDGTIARGYSLFEFENNTAGYDLAKKELKSPFTSSKEVDLKTGKELYNIYCAVCHGSKGDGQGILMKREKFLGIPSYADREITDGSIYHVLMYGKNAMGSHAGQVNATERWQIAQHVMYLRNELTK